jgi:hypothetical protein
LHELDADVAAADVDAPDAAALHDALDAAGCSARSLLEKARVGDSLRKSLKTLPMLLLLLLMLLVVAVMMIQIKVVMMEEMMLTETMLQLPLCEGCHREAELLQS